MSTNLEATENPQKVCKVYALKKQEVHKMSVWKLPLVKDFSAKKSAMSASKLKPVKIKL